MNGPLQLRDRRIAITGRLASMTRAEAEERIRAAGGAPTADVDAQTDLLVVGQGGWPLARDGRPTRSLRAAEELGREGRGPRVVDEREFVAALGLAGPELSAQYTTAQLARILDVPPAQLRAWVRAGLIRPARVVRRMWTFDFKEVVSARSLHRLLRAGASPSALARGLEQLERWLPDARRSLAQLATFERRGDLLVRTRSGRLAEPNGQLRLFAPDGADVRPPTDEIDGSEEAGGATITPLQARRASPDEESEDTAEKTGDPQLIDAGLALERAGRLAEAAAVYRTAIERDPETPELWFNLGNVEYALGRVGDAARSLRRAVELDPEFVESWNNLGNALAESGRSEEASAAWQRAVALDPGCADAHFNLAEELAALGHLDAARRHATICLSLLPDDAPEALHVRRLLRAGGDAAER
jgi:tetratricopeptide (TPR) repeat protein